LHHLVLHPLHTCSSCRCPSSTHMSSSSSSTLRSFYTSRYFT
jgi:hypothetical protein